MAATTTDLLTRAPERVLSDAPVPRCGRASVARDAACACGQALECSHTAHCPRCGVTLHG